MNKRSTTIAINLATLCLIFQISIPAESKTEQKVSSKHEKKIQAFNLSKRAYHLLLLSKVNRYCSEFSHCSAKNTDMDTHRKTLLNYLLNLSKQSDKSAKLTAKAAIADINSTNEELNNLNIECVEPFALVRKKLNSELMILNETNTENLKVLEVKVKESERELARSRQRLKEAQKATSKAAKESIQPVPIPLEMAPATEIRKLLDGTENLAE